MPLLCRVSLTDHLVPLMRVCICRPLRHVTLCPQKTELAAGEPFSSLTLLLMDALRVALGVGELQELDELRQLRVQHAQQSEIMAPYLLQMALGRVCRRALARAPPQVTAIEISIGYDDDTEAMLFFDAESKQSSYILICSSLSIQEVDSCNVYDNENMVGFLGRYAWIAPGVDKVDRADQITAWDIHDDGDDINTLFVDIDGPDEEEGYSWKA